jgi:hypothetical protein
VKLALQKVRSRSHHGSVSSLTSLFGVCYEPGFCLESAMFYIAEAHSVGIVLPVMDLMDW